MYTLFKTTNVLVELMMSNCRRGVGDVHRFRSLEKVANAQQQVKRTALRAVERRHFLEQRIKLAVDITAHQTACAARASAQL